MFSTSSDMTVSLVTSQRCELFAVVRTDWLTDERRLLTYPPSDYLTAVHRAARYQRTFDPRRQRYDYRVTSCD
jgi:hypothetical protein